MPGRIGTLEWVLVLLLALILFGPDRISKVGAELGKSIHAFQAGLRGENIDEEKNEQAASGKQSDSPSSEA